MSNFTLQIKHKDQILRESRDKEIFLPFNSEYSILIKNNADRRAKVSVTVDGTDILGNNQIIINPFKTLELDRFMIDGNLESGRKLLFVQKDDSRVQDPTSKENGNIVVQCWLEKEKKVVEHHHHYHYHYDNPWKWGEPYITFGTGTPTYTFDPSYGTGFPGLSNTTGHVDSFSTKSFCNVQPDTQTGATVESDNFSDLKFEYSTDFIEYEENCTILSLTLKSCVCKHQSYKQGIEYKKTILELWDKELVSTQFLCEQLGIHYDDKKKRVILD